MNCGDTQNACHLNHDGDTNQDPSYFLVTRQAGLRLVGYVAQDVLSMVFGDVDTCDSIEIVTEGVVLEIEYGIVWLPEFATTSSASNPTPIIWEPSRNKNIVK